MFSSISYVVPIYNEELNIINTITKIKEAFYQNDMDNLEIILLMMGQPTICQKLKLLLQKEIQLNAYV